MFPFASLFHEIPLFIMAFAYVIWFGVYTLNRSHESTGEIQSARDEVLISSQETPDGNITCLDLRNIHVSADQADTPSGLKSAEVFRLITGTLRPPEENRPSLLFRSSGLFCRPPPR